MLDLLDNGFEKTGVIPDAIFTGHVHNYQRFTRTHSTGKKVPYIVAGAGGYWHLHWIAAGCDANVCCQKKYLIEMTSF